MVFNATSNNIYSCVEVRVLELWCLMPLSTIYHNGVRVMVFNATSNNIYSCVEVRVMVFNATSNNIYSCVEVRELWCLMPHFQQYI